MNCEYHVYVRTKMFNEIYNIENGIGRDIVESADSCIDILMGKAVHGFELKDMLKLWKISCRYVSKIYSTTLSKRIGIVG